MNGKTLTHTPLAETARERAKLAQRHRDDTIEEIKENFALLLQLRDRTICKLETELAQATQRTAPPRLLIVDEGESIPQIVNRYLEGQSVEVVSVPGNEAADHVRSDGYDAILIEAATVIGPDMDGMTLCRNLCGNGKRGAVIVTSSRPGERIRKSAEEAGAAFLRKPFRRDQLVKLLRTTLHTAVR